jgi:hypothetical protein
LPGAVPGVALLIGVAVPQLVTAALITAGGRRALVAAGPASFISSWLLMIFAGVTGAGTGIRPFGYLTSMVVTIGLWLTLAPAVGAIACVGEKADRAAV